MADYCNKNLIDVRKSAERGKIVDTVIIISLIVLFLLLIYLKTFVFMVVSVSGDSMKNTLHGGDLLFANTKRTPERGDIVVVYDLKVNDEPLIKRVVGLEGDMLWTENGYLCREYVDDKGNVCIEKLDEPYVSESGVTKMAHRVTVPEGYIFVLGDNRAASYDSIDFGPVKTSSVLGVVPKWSVDIKDGVFITWYKKIINA